jgi:hypothetical protein
MWVPELGRRLSGQLLAIWEGRSGLSPEKEDAYRRAWRAKWGGGPPVPEPTRTVRDDGTTPRPGGLSRPVGPGTELKKLIAELGIKGWSGCGCEGLAAEMDRLGVSGVRERLDHYDALLREKAGEVGLVDKLRAAGNAVLSGLAFRLDPRDPYPGLIEEACRRAEAAAK